MAKVEIEQLHYESELVRLGTFQCPPSYPGFDKAGKITSYVLAFPRTSVYIQYAGEKQPIVADPNVVMLYNPGQDYRRLPLSAHGDISDWFAFDPAVVREVIRPYDPHVLDREQQLFIFSHGPSAAETYLLHRLVQRYASDTSRHDPLFIEETLQHILGRVVAFAYRARGQVEEPARPRTARAHRDLAYGARAFLARHYRDGLALDEIAAALHTSTFHLCRVFRRQTGQTIHNYRNQLRLRRSLELVAAAEDGLTEVALSLGYASHSHFSDSFSKTFGMPPSTLRAHASMRQILEMSKILKA